MNFDPKNALIRDYNYNLPQERIAFFPLSQRDQSKLLHYREGKIDNRKFTDLPDLVPSGSLMVFNDTRVIEARILFQKSTGGVIEIFCLEPYQQSMEEAMQQRNSATWKCLIGGASKWKPGQVLEKQLVVERRQVVLYARYRGKEVDEFLIEFSWSEPDIPFINIIHEAGAMPLPPYIKRTAEISDKERYQTVFSKHDGSVAAPTASLHFTPAILQLLRDKGVNTAFVTLHVGAGTFKPVKSEQIGAHQMHGEPFSVSSELLTQLIKAETIIAVGTTSLRTLESLYWIGVKLMGDPGASLVLEQWEAYELEQQFGHPATAEALKAVKSSMKKNKLDHLHCRTSLLIAPGYKFHLPHALVTNFHQPQSTLILLVAAFVGEDWRKIYQHALDNDYRFLSYGDSSLLWKNEMKNDA
jgi:S-adenosylmethionine:tRNA ribosyltransferase-isomerase